MLIQQVGSQGPSWLCPYGSAGYSPHSCFHGLELSACGFSRYMVQAVGGSTILGSEGWWLTALLGSALVGTLCGGSDPTFPFHTALAEVLYEGSTLATNFCLDIHTCYHKSSEI